MSDSQYTETSARLTGVEPEVITPLDVEKIWRIPRSTQKKQRTTGTFIPHYYVGRRVFYRRAAVQEWVEAQERTSVHGHADQ